MRVAVVERVIAHMIDLVLRLLPLNLMKVEARNASAAVGDV